MAPSFEAVSTVATLAAVCAAGNAFVSPAGQPGQQVQTRAQANAAPQPEFVKEPLVAMQAKLGSSGLVAYGAGAGILAAVAGATTRSSRRVQRRAAAEKADIEVAQKETKPVNKLAYLEEVPPALCSQETIQNLISISSKKDLEDPPEDSYLYTLKLYAETYGKGPGKSTKMNWYEFYSLKGLFTKPFGFDPQFSVEVTKTDISYYNMRKAEIMTAMTDGVVPMMVPGPTPGVFPVLWNMGARFKWRGDEPFAGDQVRSLIVDGKFAKDFIKAMAFYRDGLKPWQRGIEIGMAHGYFIIGPFTSLGPLRNTPEAATVGLLAGIACIAAASLGGLGFATVQVANKAGPPDTGVTMFDEEGKKPGSGFVELVNWHLVGGIGGAGFAHALITIFGS